MMNFNVCMPDLSDRGDATTAAIVARVSEVRDATNDYSDIRTNQKTMEFSILSPLLLACLTMIHFLRSYTHYTHFMHTHTHHTARYELLLNEFFMSKIKV